MNSNVSTLLTTVCVCVALAAAAVDALATSQDDVRKGVLRPLDRTDRRIELIYHFHHLGKLPSRTARNRRWQWVDETLITASGDDKSDLRRMMTMCEEQGVTGIVTDTAVSFYLDAARGTDIGIVPMVNTSPLARAHGGISTWKDVLRKLRGRLGESYDHPNLLRRNGKVLVLAYRTGSFLSAEEWGKIRQGLESDGYNFQFLAAFQPHRLLARPDSDAYLRDYAEVFDGLYYWHAGTELRRKLNRLFRRVLDSLDEDKLLFTTVSSGYWRPEKGTWRPKRGTAELREAVQLATAPRPDGIFLESWDDYSENAHVQPSLENHTALFELAGYLLGGKTTPSPRPRTLLSYRKEVRLGEILKVEILALPCTSARTVDVSLIDEDERVLKTFAAQAVDAGAGMVFTYRFPTADLGNSRIVEPVVRVETDTFERTYRGAGFVRLRRGNLHMPYTRHVALHRLLDLSECKLTVGGGTFGEEVYGAGSREASFHVRGTQPLQRVDLMKNDLHTVYSADWQEYGKPGSRQLGISWDAVTKPDVGTDFSGSVRVENGRPLAAHIAPPGAISSVTGNTVTWQQNAKRHDRVGIAWSGDDATRFRVRFPQFDAATETVAGTLRQRPFEETVLGPGSRLLLRELRSPVGLPRPLKKRQVRAEFTLPDRHDDMPVDMYSLLILGPDHTLYRSRPVFVRRTRRTEKVPLHIWDHAQNKRRTISVRACDIDNAYWPLTEGSGRFAFDRGENYALLHWGAGGWGFTAELGGSFLRDGGYRPGGEPRWRSHGQPGLVFDGDNDRLYVPPRLLSPGARTLEMVIRPAELTTDRSILLVAPVRLVIMLEESGRLKVVCRRVTDDGVKKKAVLLSRTLLKPGQWYHIAVVNDLHEQILYVNGESERQSDRLRGASASRENALSFRTFAGSLRGGGQLSKFKHGFAGTLHAMRYEARALKPAEFQLSAPDITE